MSNNIDIKIELYKSIIKFNGPCYLISDNSNLGLLIDWHSKVSIRKMLLELLNNFDNQVSERIIPLTK